MFEGPLVKDKASFMIAGRRSYQDLLLRLAPDDDINSIIANFYDLNAKVNYKFSDKSRLFLSAYYGKDAFGVPGLVKFNWGNLGLTGRWNYLINDKLFLNVSTIYSDLIMLLGSTFQPWRSTTSLTSTTKTIRSPFRGSLMPNTNQLWWGGSHL